jgi:hypothetical protein
MQSCSLALDHISLIFSFIVNSYVCAVQQFNCTRHKGKDNTVSVGNTCLVGRNETVDILCRCATGSMKDYETLSYFLHLHIMSEDAGLLHSLLHQSFSALVLHDSSVSYSFQ